MSTDRKVDGNNGAGQEEPTLAHPHATNGAPRQDESDPASSGTFDTALDDQDTSPDDDPGQTCLFLPTEDPGSLSPPTPAGAGSDITFAAESGQAVGVRGPPASAGEKTCGDSAEPKAALDDPTIGIEGEVSAAAAAGGEQTLGLPLELLPLLNGANEQTLGLPVDTGEASAQTLGLPGPAAAEQHAHTLGLPGEVPLSVDVIHVQGTVRADAAAPVEDAQPTRRAGEPAAAGAVKRTAPLVRVPGYQVLGVLGRGGMGVVYKAKHLGLNRLVALKMVLAGAHAGETELARFLIEAKAIAQLQHPNIVAIYEIGEHEGKPFFSLEYLDGGSLQGKMNGVPMPPRQAAQIVETIARAIHFAHEKGIIHRDIKPANVLLTAAGAPKLTDFGLAKNLDQEDPGHTGTEAVLGTPSYMAPEQAAGKTREMGPPGDIYALGAVLYDLLCGRPPFRGATLLETLQQVQKAEPVAPARLVPTLPSDLQTICLKSLEKDPAKRYPTAKAMADELQRYLEGVPIHARPTPPWERVYKWTRRNPILAALYGCIAAAVLALGLFIVWHNVSLQQELDLARAEERLAREREQEALANERLARVQAEGKQLLHDAQLAVAGRDWANARLHLTKALATIGSEERLDGLKGPARDLLKEVEHELSVEAERRAAQARLQKFAALRDEAQFLGTLYTGMDLAANLHATRATVQQALAVYNVSVAAAEQPGTLPTLDAYLNVAQKTELCGDFYQLLLILAETEAQTGSEQKSPQQEQHLREALRLLEHAMRFGPPARAYHLRRSRYLSLLGARSEADKADKAAAAAAVVLVLDHFLVADEFYRRAQFAEALQEFDQVLQRKPGDFWAQYLSALCLLKQRRPAEAKAQLSACLAQRSDFVWLYLLRGFAQGELQAFDGAEADYARALQMPLDAFARYVLFVNRGVLRIRQDRLEDAIADLKQAIALKPNEYQAYVNLARAYHQYQQPDLALAQLQRAVELEPALALVYRLRAQLYRQRKDLALARKDLEQAIRYQDEQSPLLIDDHVELGRLLLLEHKHAEALASFDTALGLRKDHAAAQRLRAEALFQLGRFQEVITAFDRYLVKGKPLESVYRGRGLALAELGRYPGAIEDYTKALELQPTAAVLTYRGWAHLVCDAPKLALRDFELALELDAKHADAYQGRGLILASQGRRREAVRDAEAALRHGSPSPRLLYNAARILAQSGAGYDRRALELLRQALALVPSAQRAAFWSRYIRTDPALATLRDHPQFAQLEADMVPRK